MPNSPDFDPNQPYQAVPDSAPSAAPAVQAAAPIIQSDKPAFDPNKAFETEDEHYGTGLEEAKTAAEQFASGISLGTSKIAENALFDNAAERKAREEANPGISTAANIAGTGALIYGTGGLGALAEGAGTVAKIGAGAVEGGLIGGANQAADDWSDNKALDAGKIAASAGFGALLGGGGVGLIEGLKVAPGGARAILDKIDKYMTPNIVGEGAPEAGQGFVQGIKNSYQLADKDPNVFIKDLTDNLTELHGLANDASSSAYNEAGAFHLQNALEDMPVEHAKSIGQGILGDVDAMVNEAAPTSHEQLQSKAEEIQNNPKVQDVQDQLKEVQQRKAIVEQEQEFNARNREVNDPERLKTNEQWGKLGDQEDALKLKLAALQNGAESKLSAIGQRISSTANKIDFSENRQSLLSGAGGEAVNGKLNTLQNALRNAETPLDVHTALTNFATDLDKGIKFDTMPTAAQLADQELLQNVRSLVRGNLKDPEMWGKAAPVYEELSNMHAEYRNALKNFNKDWTKPRVGSNGKTVRVVDPAKVKTYFNNPNDPGQALKSKSLEDFVNSAKKRAEYGQNYDEWQGEFGDLKGDVEKVANKLGKGSDVSAVLKEIKKSGKGHGGMGDLIALEMAGELLPGPAKAAFFALRNANANRNIIGTGLFKLVKGARSLAEHAESATNKIDKGAKAIFSGTSSQEPKDD